MSLSKKLAVLLLSFTMFMNTGITVFAEGPEETEGEQTEEIIVTEEQPEEQPAEVITEAPAEETPAEEALAEEQAEESDEELIPEEEEPAAAENLEKIYTDVNDFETPAVGSDGVVYEGVNYLSVGAVSRLDEEGQALYRDFADEIADRLSEGQGIKDIVFAVSSDGVLTCSYSVTSKMFASAGSTFTQFQGEEGETAEILTEEVLEQTEALENTEAEGEEELPAEEVQDEEIVPEETEESTNPEEIIPEETGSEIEETETPEEEITSEETSEPEETVIPEAEIVSEENNETEETEAPEEEIVSEETSEPEEITNAAEDEEETYEIVEENMDLYELYSIPEELVMDEEPEEYNTVLQDMNFYYNQLSSQEKTWYKKVKSAIVSKGKNSFTYNGYYYNRYNHNAWDVLRSINAVLLTYPNKFEWYNRAGDPRVSLVRGYGSNVTFKMVLPKSKYYSKTLYSQAKKKVNELVDLAYAYAARNYPNNPAYGIVKYFDKWICENNYYNYDGTYDYMQNTSQFYYCHTCFGILLKGYGVCESYALALNWLLEKAGIRSMYTTGDVPGGGHAWNYIQMSDGKWYLQDSTWDDAGSYSSGDYLLAYPKKDGSDRTPVGSQLRDGTKFNFDTVNWGTAAYSSTTRDPYFSQVTLSETVKYLKPKKSFTLKKQLPEVGRIGSYYEKWPVTWTSSNPKVAKVSSKGKVTAVGPGSATISMVIGGVAKTCTVYVYQVSSLTFNDSGKKTLSKTYAKNSNVTVVNNQISAVFNNSDVQTVYLTVNQKNQTRTAAQLQNAVGLTVTAKSAKPSILEVQSASVSGNQIVLKVKPNKIGKTTVTVKFGGKSAKLTFATKYSIKESWFDFSSLNNTYTYTGKAIKPKIIKSISAPKGIKYKVKYTNNVKAGNIATVTVTGSGNYSGAISKTFYIQPIQMSNAKVTKFTESKSYTGSAVTPTMVVKVGSKTLKEGRDYYLVYSNSRTFRQRLNTLIAKGTYYVRIYGKGNYGGYYTIETPFVIK